MDFVHKYPMSSLHELNLDWIIDKVKELDSKVGSQLEAEIRRVLDQAYLNATYDEATETLTLNFEVPEG